MAQHRPDRAGRTKAVAGVPSQPYTFYIGVVQRRRLEDDRRRPHVEADLRRSADRIDRLGGRRAVRSEHRLRRRAAKGLQRPDLSVGDGIYKSHRRRQDVDASAACATRSRFRRSSSIRAIRIGCSSPRSGIRTARTRSAASSDRLDGGQTFEKVLYKDENTGGKDVDIDPSNPDIVYATMWEERQGPWENGAWSGTGGGIFKSTDGGTTWTQLQHGLPDGRESRSREPRDRAERGRRRAWTRRSRRGGRRHRRSVALATTPATTGARDHTAITRRRRGSRDARPVGAERPIPKDADTLIVTDVVTYKSTDGGKTWVPFKGAPGGDDYQNAWINPNDPNIILLVIDQGAVVSLNGGAVVELLVQPVDRGALSRDDRQRVSVSRVRRPAGQRLGVRREPRQRRRDHGARVASGRRSRSTATPRPIRSIPTSSTAARSRATTGAPAQVSNVVPPAAVARRGGRAPARRLRTVRTQPVVFSQVDPHALFFGNNVLWKTIDGGDQLDADQSRPHAQDARRAEERRQVRVERASARRRQRRA